MSSWKVHLKTFSKYIQWTDMQCFFHFALNHKAHTFKYCIIRPISKKLVIFSFRVWQYFLTFELRINLKLLCITRVEIIQGHLWWHYLRYLYYWNKTQLLLFEDLETKIIFVVQFISILIQCKPDHERTGLNTKCRKENIPGGFYFAVFNHATKEKHFMYLSSFYALSGVQKSFSKSLFSFEEPKTLISIFHTRGKCIKIFLIKQCCHLHLILL